MDDSFYSKISLNTKQAEDLEKTVKSTELLEIAQRFAKNINDADILLRLPVIMLATSEIVNLKTMISLQVLSERENLKDLDTSASARDQIEREINRRYANRQAEPFDTALKRASSLFKEDSFTAAVILLIHSVLTSTWTAFECLSNDTWITMVNIHPLPLAHGAMLVPSESDAIDGLTNKSISLGLLAKYRFDLHDRMGTLLAPKFDFTGVSGTRTAFFYAFGKTPALEAILSDQDLANLEATRHMLVHRAGIIDEEYRRRTSSNEALGETFQPDADAFSELFNAAITAGCGLLGFTDSWLQDHRPQA